MPSRCAVLVFVIAIVALIVTIDRESASAGTYASPCAFDIPLRVSDCARLIHSRRRAEEIQQRAIAPSATLLYASETFQAAIATFIVGKTGLTPAGGIDLGSSDAAPTGLTVDGSQNLYAAVSSFSQNGPQEVLVFRRGDQHPVRTYRDGLTGPVSVAIGADGTLYVANLTTPDAPLCTSPQGNGTVVEFARGSLKPTTVLTGIPGCPDAVALDASSNLYVTYSLIAPGVKDASDVLEYRHGSKTGMSLHLSLPESSSLYGVAFDSTGSLVVENSTEDNSLNQILIYPRGSRKAKRTIEYGGFWAPERFALWNDRLFAPAYLAESLPMAAAEFDYPSGQQVAAQNPPGLYYYGFAVSAP